MNCSDELIELLNGMFEFHPQRRYSLMDVIGHPWMAGKMPTVKEVQSEFAERHQIVNENTLTEEVKKLNVEVGCSSQNSTQMGCDS